MSEIVSAICFMGGLFALIALMPDFDGWREDDWERRDPGEVD
jgi:hypothetical protein